MENGYNGKIDSRPSHLPLPGASIILVGGPSGRRERGFTIVELMTVVLIVAVLAVIAVPSFDSVIKRNRIESMQSQFSAALAMARTEATTRNALVTVCASNGGEACVEDNGNWGNGWLVFIDNDGDTELDADEQVLEVFRNQNNNYSVNAVAGIAQANANYIAYGYRGFLKRNEQPTLITFCEPGNDTYFARGLFVNASGIVMKTRDGADAGSVHDSPLAANADLTCN